MLETDAVHLSTRKSNMRIGCYFHQDMPEAFLASLEALLQS